MKRLALILCLLLSCPVNEREITEAHSDLPKFSFEEAAVHPARCAYEDCVCTVKIPEYQPIIRNIKTTYSESAFFEEGQSLLSAEEKQKVRNFTSSHIDADAIFIMGYTDGCGSYNYNTLLAADRARSGQQTVRSAGFSRKIIVASMSELTSTHSDYARRIDITTTNNFTLKVPPPNLTADHYLLDASGSMQDYRVWVNIIAANKKNSSRLHLSYTRKCSNGSSALSISPSGATEIWYSYWQVLDKMKPGQTLIILSDFNSRYPLSQKDANRLNEKVKRKGVKVYAVSL